MGTARAQYVAIPDSNFGNWLSMHSYASCLSGNSTTGWQLDTVCAGSQAATSMSCTSAYIRDLTGIRYFKNITYLVCRNNNMATLPELPPRLATLYTDNTQLTSLYSVAFPSTLQFLYCYGNHLTSIPVLPTGLKLLSCYGNQLTSIASLPDSLTSLDCGNNMLTALPPLPTSLTSLTCSRNVITALPQLSPRMTYLVAANNRLTAIPALPDSIYFITCDNNLLTSLPALPRKLSDLSCTYNMITSIPSLSGTVLTTLYCQHNLLTSLPALPNKLAWLNCAYNRISSLPVLPDSLLDLNCSKNQLTILPEIPEKINNINCDSNMNLSCMSRIRSTSMGGFRYNATQINCMPNRFNDASCGGCIPLKPSLLPLCRPEDGCPSVYSIAGNVHTDTSATCSGDSIHSGPPLKMKVLLRHNGQVQKQTYSSATGFYSFLPDSLYSYTVNIDTTGLPLSISCPGPQGRTITLTTADSVRYAQDFGVECGSGTDNGVLYMSDTRFRTGQATTVYILAGQVARIYGLHCTTHSSGTVTTIIRGPAHYTGPAAASLAPTAVSGDTLRYTIADYDSLTENSFDINARVDSLAGASSPVTITTIASTTGTDINRANDTLTRYFSVRNSFDPNEKTVSPEVAPAGGGWLTYTIHFQNTGNDTAYRVVVRDTLSSYLIPESFQLLGASHSVNTELTGSAVAFSFERINLPHSAASLTASQGWVQFRVKSRAPLALGTRIPNRAAIFFDLNTAIYTNTATTTIAAAVACSDTTINITQAICAGDTLRFYGQVLTAQGSYTDTIPRAGGCDSIISLTLTVHTRYRTSLDDTICSGSRYVFGGDTLTVAGTYGDTLQTVNGCDSIVSLSLVVRGSDFHFRYDTICSGDTLRYLSDIFTHTDTAIYIWQNVHGCDSTVALFVAVRPAPVVTWTMQGYSIVMWCTPPYPIALYGGFPQGGNFSGPFVHNDSIVPPNIFWFDSTFTVTYSYSDIHGCIAKISKVFGLVIGCEGIYDIANLNDIQLYPNPNTGTFTLTTTNSRNQDYTITNALGEIIEQKAITADTQTIDMGYAAAGVYTLYVKGARPVRFTVVR